jgi:two-component system chemotaxis sensor kinase CheA
VAQELEAQLMGVLIETLPGERRTDSVNSLLNGPVINADGRSRRRCLTAAGRRPARQPGILGGSAMSDFAGMEDLLQDFLQEAGDLLSDVDNKLVDLERSPDDHRLLNDIFRGFHTIKGGAGFLNAAELVRLCHLTENLFDKLRNAEMTLTPALMDTIMAATQSVRTCSARSPRAGNRMPAAAEVTANLRAALEGSVPSAPGCASLRRAPRGACRQASPVRRGRTEVALRWSGLAGPACGVTGQAVPVPAVAGVDRARRDGRRLAGEDRIFPAAAALPARRAPQHGQAGGCGQRAPSGRRADERRLHARRPSGSIRRAWIRCSTCLARSV